jgi:hypothetical protein
MINTAALRYVNRLFPLAVRVVLAICSTVYAEYTVNVHAAPLSTIAAEKTLDVYIWTGAVNTDWTLPQNWSPNRVNPQPTDVIEFNPMQPWTVTNVPTETISQLTIFVMANVTFVGQSSGSTLTITNSATNLNGTLQLGNPDGSNPINLAIPSGSTLNVQGGAELYVAAGAVEGAGDFTAHTGSAISTARADGINGISQTTGAIQVSGLVNYQTDIMLRMRGSLNQTMNLGSVGTKPAITAVQGLYITKSNPNAVVTLATSLTVGSIMVIDGGVLETMSGTTLQVLSAMVTGNGTLRLRGSFSNTGTTDVMNGGRLEMVDNTSTYLGSPPNYGVLPPFGQLWYTGAHSRPTGDELPNPMPAPVFVAKSSTTDVITVTASTAFQQPVTVRSGVWEEPNGAAASYNEAWVVETGGTFRIRNAPPTVSFFPKPSYFRGSTLELDNTGLTVLGGLMSSPMQGNVLARGNSRLQVPAGMTPLTLNGTLSLLNTSWVDFDAARLVCNGVVNLSPGPHWGSGDDISSITFNNGIAGAVEFFPNAVLGTLVVNVGAGRQVQLVSPLTVVSLLHLQSGLVLTSPAAVLQLGAIPYTPTLTGGSPTSYIVGPFRVVTQDPIATLKFPVGTFSAYRGFELRGVSLVPNTTVDVQVQVDSLAQGVMQPGAGVAIIEPFRYAVRQFGSTLLAAQPAIFEPVATSSRVVGFSPVPTGNVTGLASLAAGQFVQTAAPFTSWSAEQYFALGLAQPIITSFSPAQAASGATVTITGQNLAGAQTVRFGTATATSYSIDPTGTVIRAVVGSTGATGRISVTTPAATAFSPTVFVFLPPPVVQSVTPLIANSSTVATIVGGNFTAVQQVRVGGIAVQQFMVNSTTQITAVLGAVQSGLVTIVGQNGAFVTTSSIRFVPPPTVTSFSPTVAGAGVPVLIRGTDFVTNSLSAGVERVRFGGVQAQSVTVLSTTQILAVPATTGSSGVIDVSAFGGTGTSSTLTLFTFEGPPTVTNVQPLVGVSTTPITITGTDFRNVQQVLVGGVPVASFTVNAPTRITALLSTGASGVVTVVTAGGRGTSPQNLTFVRPPTISAFSPTVVGAGGSVNISGTNYVGVTNVRIAGVTTSVTVLSSTQIVALVPDGFTEGRLTVTNLAGSTISVQTLRLDRSPTLTAVQPSVISSGAVVTLVGTNLANAPVVILHNDRAQILSASPSQLVVRIPNRPSSLAAGQTQARITVTTPFGTTSGQVTFVDEPVITGLDPEFGTTGTVVVLRGQNLQTVTSGTIIARAPSGELVVIPLQLSPNAVGTAIVATVGAVPPNVTVGTVVLAFPGRTLSAPVPFRISDRPDNEPRILSLNPLPVVLGGDMLRINGVNLRQASAVTIAGLPVQRVLSRSATELIVHVPFADTTGVARLTTPFGVAASVDSVTIIATLPSRRLSPIDNDSLALIRLYRENNGKQWHRQNAWLTTLSVAQWQGVTVATVNGVRRVVALELPYNNLSGSLTEALAALTSLQKLNLSGNNLTDTLNNTAALPRWIGQLRALEELRLVNTRLTEALPPELGLLPLLRVLALDSNRLSGVFPAPLCLLGSLRELTLANNRFVGTLPPLCFLPPNVQNAQNASSVSVPNMSKSASASVAALTGLSGLTVLDLSNNGFSGTIPSEFGSVRGLQHLALANNRLTGAVPNSLTSLSMLRTLTLGGNSLTRLPNFADIRRLRLLSVERNHLPPDDLEPNTAIETFVFLPQDSLGVERDTTAALGVSFVLPSLSSGARSPRNRYAWFKIVSETPTRQLQEIAGQTGNALVINRLSQEDAGRYVCRITNSDLQNAEFWTRPVQIRTIQPRVPNEIPSLLAPSNGSHNVPPFVVFRWSEVSGAGTFEVQIAENANFSPVAVQTSVAVTQATVSGLRAERSYFWRVRAVNPAGASAWSAVWSFRTAAANALLTLDADFGRVTIGERVQRVAQVVNLTDMPVRVERVAIQDAENSFSVLTDFPEPVQIASRSSVSVVLSCFPRSVGAKRGAVQIRYTTAATPTTQVLTLPDAVRARGGALAVDAVNFDTVVVGRTALATALIVNRSSHNAQLRLARVVGNTQVFSALDNDDLPPAFLGAGDTTAVIVRCRPTTPGLQRGQFLVEADVAGERETLETSMQAESRERLPTDAFAGVVVRLQPDSAAAGEQVFLELRLLSTNLRQLFNTTQPDVSAVVKFDRNVLALSASELRARTIRNQSPQNRIQRVSVPPVRWNGLDTVLLRLPLVAVAGDTDRTVLEIERVLWGNSASRGTSNGMVFIDSLVQGQFRVAVCEANGKRFVRLANAVVLAVLAPNPVADVVTVAYSVRQADVVTLSVVDARGGVVKRIVSSLHQAGLYERSVPVSDIAAGAYQLLLQASGEAVRKPLVIVR